MSFWNKLDAPLAGMYTEWIQSGRRQSADRNVLVSLFFQGRLEEIEEVGFETTWRGPTGYATGGVSISGLQRVAEHDGVVRMSFGEESEPLLDLSVPQIRATPDVWTFSSGTFAGTTGKGAIVGVIDTGIDWDHPFFMAQTTPTRKTRILAIWDMGLRPEGAESAPDAALITAESGGTYGVEYTKAQIDAALDGGTTIRHRDCNGHGTHVASIAAGDGRDAGTYIGVAPEAELIIVKYLYPEVDPTKDNDPAAPEVNWNIRFRDAVTYILEKAKALGDKPVAINASLGSASGPHDGFTTNEDWLTEAFEDRDKACFVTSAGNSGGDDQHALLEFTAAGSVEVPIELYDGRTVRKKFNHCEWRDETRTQLNIELYYPAAAGPLTVEFDPDDGTGFHALPARGGAASTLTFDGHTAVLTHIVETQPLPHTGRPDVTRSKAQVSMQPRSGHYRLGDDYKLKITAPGAVKAYLWCGQKGGAPRGHGLRVISPDPPILTKPEKHLIGRFGGADHVLTVAAYNAEVDPGFPVTGFSSRGPLVNYSGAVPIPKPDLAAPGRRVDAAASRYTEPKKKKRKRTKVGGTTQKSGTSMSSPHVAGVVALMFEKKADLKSSEIQTILRGLGLDAVPPAEEDELGKGRIDAKKAFDATP